MSSWKRYIPVALVGLLVALFAGGSAVRGQLDFEIDAGSMAGMQASLQNLRVWVDGLGWPGPAIFIVLVTFRVFLLLPSAVVLSAGGLAFGALLGTALGTVGIALSALLKFAIARGAGRQAVMRALGARFLQFEARVERAGVWLVGLVTAHPAAPMSSVHWAAGLSSMSWLAFGLAVLIAGPVRAGMYSVLGAAIVDLDWRVTVALAAAFTGIGLIPLAFPRVRARLFGHGASAAAVPRDPLD